VFRDAHPEAVFKVLRWLEVLNALVRGICASSKWAGSTVLVTLWKQLRTDCGAENGGPILLERGHKVKWAAAAAEHDRRIPTAV